MGLKSWLSFLRGGRSPRQMFVLALAACLGLTAALTTRAHAQQRLQLFGGPITTNRFERTIRAYVAPTDLEMSALYRLHESYLDKFGTEIEPEIVVHDAEFSLFYRDVIVHGRNSDNEKFEKFLRVFDRINARIAEADNAFFAAATDLLPLDRQGTMLRVREARERQRLLSGFMGYGLMMTDGNCGSFVDFPNLMAKPSILNGVSAESREMFDSALRSQETRVLSQARTYNAEIRRSLTKFFDICGKIGQGEAVAVEGEPSAFETSPNQIAITQALDSLVADLRKGMKSNFDANRSACAQFASMLPESTMLTVRMDLAKRAVGDMGIMGYGRESMSDRGVKSVVAKIRRDGAFTPEVKAEVETILGARTKDIVPALEALAVAVVESKTTHGAALTTALDRIWRVSQESMTKLAALLGDRSEEFFGKDEYASKDGMPTVFYYPLQEDKPSDDETEAAQRQGFLRPVFVRSGLPSVYGAPVPFDAADILRIGTLVGFDSSKQSVVEAVVEQWKATQWDVQMNPLSDTLTSALSQQVGVGVNGEVIVDIAAANTVDRTRGAMAKLLFELDELLYADLAGALGLAANDPTLMLLRLERTDVIPTWWGDSTTLENVAFPCSVSRLLAAGKVDSKTARAVIEGSSAEFTALASELPAQVARRMMEKTEKIESLRPDLLSRDQPRKQKASVILEKLLVAWGALDAEFGASISVLFNAAVDANVADPATNAALKRACMRSMYPEIYRVQHSAERQLAASTQLAGLSEDQLARLDALRAEYEVIYDALSVEMAAGGSWYPPRSLGATVKDWRWGYPKRAAAIEQIRFRRSERTEKTLGELRRILGSELAASVPGLVIDPEADANANGNGGVFTDANGKSWKGHFRVLKMFTQDDD